MRFRQTIATTVAAAALSVGAVSLAPAAEARPTDTGARKEQVCQRAHEAWQKIITANEKAVSAYHEYRAKQQELLANRHVVAAHRLDAALDRARRAHGRLVARAVAIGQRVKGFCTERPLALTPVEQSPTLGARHPSDAGFGASMNSGMGGSCSVGCIARR